MKKTKTSKVNSAFAAAALAFAPLLIAHGASAQQGKQPTQRVVEGTVQGKDGQPLKGVVVFLKDDKTLFIKSYLTDDAGHFKFSQLSLAADYDLWAQHGENYSKSRHIGPFNDKPDLDFTLKVD